MAGSSRVGSLSDRTRASLLSGHQIHVVGVGDFNGDGKAGILLRHAASGDAGMWIVNGSNITSAALVQSPATVYDVH